MVDVLASDASELSYAGGCLASGYEVDCVVGYGSECWSCDCVMVVWVVAW